jgi:hypothetical protein
MEAVAIRTTVNLVTMNSSATDLRYVVEAPVNLMLILVLLVPAMRIITHVAVMDIVRLVKIIRPVHLTALSSAQTTAIATMVFTVTVKKLVRMAFVHIPVIPAVGAIPFATNCGIYVKSVRTTRTVMTAVHAQRIFARTLWNIAFVTTTPCTAIPVTMGFPVTEPILVIGPLVLSMSFLTDVHHLRLLRVVPLIVSAELVDQIPTIVSSLVGRVVRQTRCAMTAFAKIPPPAVTLVTPLCSVKPPPLPIGAPNR